MAETFTALTGSVLVGGTHYAEVRSIRATIPDMQGIEEVRTFGDGVYIKRTRPEGVGESTMDVVVDTIDFFYEFGSPTPNDPQGPITPVDYLWQNQETGSYFRLRFASVYPTSVEFRQDRDGHLEGTVTFQYAKKDVSYYYSGAAPS